MHKTKQCKQKRSILTQTTTTRKTIKNRKKIKLKIFRIGTVTQIKITTTSMQKLTKLEKNKLRPPPLLNKPSNPSNYKQDGVTLDTSAQKRQKL